MLIYQFSRAGRFHERRPERNQDAVLSGKTEHFCAIALSDGVSSCAEAKTGAEIANASVLRLLLSQGGELMSLPPESAAKRLLSHVTRDLERRAISDNQSVEAYSSTAAAALLQRATRRLKLFHLGDSLILSLRGASCGVLSIPGDSRQGCCCTTTRNAFLQASVRDADAGRMDAVIICSDGAWRLMYERTRIKLEVRSMLADGDYRRLERYLRKADGADDCSFIVMDWRAERRLSA